MNRNQVTLPERFVIARYESGIETRPSGLEFTHPELAAILEAFRMQAAEDSTLGFVFLAKGSKSFRVRLDYRSESPVQVSLEAMEASIPLGLTARELDVLSLLSAGMSYASIAISLRISKSTVTTHAEHIFAKLLVDNRTEAAILAIQQGAVRLPLPVPVDSESLLCRIDRDLRNLVASDWKRLATAVPAYKRSGAALPRSIRLGHVYPLNDAEGQEMQMGAQLAVDEVNAGGGIHGRSLELLSVGVDVSSIDEIKVKTNGLIQENIDALSFGYAFPRDSLPELLSFWKETELPILHSLTSQFACDIVATGSGYENVFQLCPSDINYGDEFLRSLQQITPQSSKNGLRRDVIMLTDDPQMADHHAPWAGQALGIGFDLSLIRVTNEAEAIEAARVTSDASPLVVFLACFRASNLRSFLRQFMLAPSRSLLYALWSPGTSDFRDDLVLFEGLLWSTTTGRYADVHGKRFEDHFRQRFNRPVYGTSASIQYDSVGILTHAWQRSGRPDSYRSTSREIRQLIHRGINGSYFFGSEHQRTLAYGIDSRDASLSQAHLVYQIQDGVNKIIAPFPYASARYRPQPWTLSLAAV